MPLGHSILGNPALPGGYSVVRIFFAEGRALSPGSAFREGPLAEREGPSRLSKSKCAPFPSGLQKNGGLEARQSCVQRTTTFASPGDISCTFPWFPHSALAPPSLTRRPKRHVSHSDPRATGDRQSTPVLRKVQGSFSHCVLEAIDKSLSLPCYSHRSLSFDSGGLSRHRTLLQAVFLV